MCLITSPFKEETTGYKVKNYNPNPFEIINYNVINDSYVLDTQNNVVISEDQEFYSNLEKYIRNYKKGYSAKNVFWNLDVVKNIEKYINYIVAKLMNEK